MTAINYIPLREAFLEYLPELTGEQIRVFLCLLHREGQQANIKTALTLSELAHMADLSENVTYRCLDKLNDQGVGFFISMVQRTKQKGQFNITIGSYWIPNAKTIPFNVDKEDTRTQELEAEVRRLNQQIKNHVTGERSGLDEELTNLDERAMITEIESDLGRGITVLEAYRLGQSVQGWNPERIKGLWRKRAYKAKNPIRALHAMLWNGTVGPPAAQKEYAEPSERIYPDL